MGSNNLDTRQKVIYVAVNEGGNGEDDFTKFTRVPVSVVGLGERHHRFRTYSKERETEMLSSAQRDLGVDVGVTLQHARVRELYFN